MLVFVLKMHVRGGFYTILMDVNHRIKDDRMENSIKGKRVWHCTFAASIILCSLYIHRVAD